MMQMMLAAAAGGAVEVANVFKALTYSGGGASQQIDTDPLDLTQDKNLVWIKNRTTGSSNILTDTVRGANLHLKSNSSAVEDTSTNYVTSFDPINITNGFTLGTDGDVNGSGKFYVAWVFKSAAKFFDIVTWTGDGSSSRTISHSLGTSPRLMITKGRDEIENWFVYSEPTGNGKLLRLSNTSAELTTNIWNNTTPGSSSFSISGSTLNSNTKKYIAYLFGDIPGVIKVGSYTGTGSNIDVDCGFTNGAQFVLIKQTDVGRNWYVFDTARGITTGNEPNLLWDSSSSETTTQDLVDPLSTGFRVRPGILGTNASGGEYIYMAIAAS